MYKVALLALVLSLAAANVHNHYQDTHAVLAQIDEDPFGAMVLSAIQTHIQAKAPEDEVVLLLNQVASGINDDQRSHDVINRTDQAACDRIIVDLENNIAYHTAQIAANEQLRDDSTEALEQGEIDVRQVTKDIADNEATAAREKNTRDNQHTTFVRKDGELDAYLVAIDEAAKVVQHLQLGSSFAQVKTRFESVHKKLEQFSAKEALFKPIIAALVELQSSSQVDFKAIQTIAELIAQLRQNLVANKVELNQIEEKQAQNYAVFSNDLQNEHSRLVDRKAQLEAFISLQKENIQVAEEALEYHTVELENAQDGLARQEAWCAVQSETYETQTNNRAGQLDLVSRIQEHVSEHLSAAGQYIAGRRV